MQESPAIWQPQRRDLESFFFLFTPPSPLPPNGERSFSPLLLNLRVGRDARPRGRPHRSHQNATTIEVSYPMTCVWESLRAPRFLRETYFLKRHSECGESGGDLRITKCWDGRRRLWLAVSNRSMKSYFAGVRSPRVKLCCLGISLHAFGEIQLSGKR